MKIMRPTVALAMIVKNERPNLPRLLLSVQDCFDEIHITDTGSDDGTVEYLQSAEASEFANCPIHVHHFKWVHDFSAARNASMDPVKTDYVVWMDGDDVLSDRQAFIHFRDFVMNTADYWLVKYNYAWDPSFTKPTCTFARERVINTKKGLKWHYFVHEGMVVPQGAQGIRMQKCESWTIDHYRTDADMEKDRSRNISLFEEHERTTGLCPRMTYYYGKELFESKRYMEAGSKLLEASKLRDLDMHDRIMCLQYLMASAMECGQFALAIEIGHQGLKLVPSRAEYLVLMGDAYIRLNRLADAAIFYGAARECRPVSGDGLVIIADAAYDRYPTEQLAIIYINLGNFDRAETEISRLEKMVPERAKDLRADLARLRSMGTVQEHAVVTDDIVITSPPMGGPNQDWDEEMHEKRGLGGSETAAVELAEYWQKTTGRNVIIFNNRKEKHVSKSGVTYLPVQEVPTYFLKYRPYIHIAWRHSARLTSAPSYLWCHDLFTPGAENTQNYDKIICLSPFHQSYVRVLQNIPSEKTMLMRNGIEPRHFKQPYIKNENKIIFPSSPDRGLDRCIEIISRARKNTELDLELHVFYGFENMRAMGMAAQADRLEGMMKANPWVKYHGNVKKHELARHFLESAIWLYPADFIETFCITALEAAAGGCFSLIRNFGGVVDTARPFVFRGMAEIVNSDASTPEELDFWSARLEEALLQKKWQNVKVNVEELGWEAVAKEWADRLKLTKSSAVVAG